MLVQNGCDFFPPGSWDLCCNIHDYQYFYGNNWVDRLVADLNLYTCTVTHAPIIAAVLFLGVRLGGWFFFEWKFLGKKSIYELITGKDSAGQF